MLKRLELPAEAHARLQAHARRRGLIFLSTPFDTESSNLLRALNVPAFKVSSGEITNLPLLRHIARFGRPVLLSTGMSTLDEVATAVRAIRRAGNPPLALLHCVSSYPAELRDVNLRAMLTLADRFRVPVGYSDHTLGIAAAIAAVALGASIVEKHLTLDRTMDGPDHAASLEPGEFAEMVARIREIEAVLGSPIKRPVRRELPIRRAVRRSLVTTAIVPKGARITHAMVACKRPGTGLPPSAYGTVVGRRAARRLPADHLLRPHDLV
jgi:N-acetylneuraminate synthase/N,N'-diacetyllegionaminate synthase